MGLFNDFLKRSGSMLVDSAFQGLGSSRTNGDAKVCDLLAKLGWAIDERVNNSIVLNFRDSVVGIRKVYVTVLEDAYALFSVASVADFTYRNMPEDFASYLLIRNSKSSFGCWQMSDSNRQCFSFTAMYTAILPGLEPAAFKVICENLCTEAREVDSGLREKGLI
ncbi:hypothetical protein [Zavarzinella formosa]|uniref:hypothetical protein n=1 Tax=Zavarzinella formosa TaxID=360055 RepID=UPI0003781642|nr:hypothetical protein [Zavarzinella formosa]